MTKLRMVVPVLLVVAGAVFLPGGAASAGGACHRAGPAPEGSGTTVEMDGLCMTPGVLRVGAGETVTFVNRDGLAHNVFGTGWNAGVIAPGASGTATFATAGSYPYACTLHPGMVGAIEVGDPTAIDATPAAATREADGDGANVVALVLTALVAAGAGGLVGTRRRRA